MTVADFAEKLARLAERRYRKRCNDSRFSDSRSQMITFLDGKLVTALPTQATVDVNGIGYQVLIPLSSFDRLPAAHMYHSVAGLQRTGQDFTARMIAAEALSRT